MYGHLYLIERLICQTHDTSSVESNFEHGIFRTQSLDFSTRPPWQVSLLSYPSAVGQCALGGLDADHSSDCLGVIGIVLYNFLECRVVACH
ncbi:hypothetical protein AVEN_197365-1 [Araneus ventricosus]|uniref:Uncharacterized protein n=1 Tax=Araneus ventricosus TaxID=182803 RepID=A0A4Y2K7K4_ARAVE|nr:hypothetical protein AVEN_197365-1 [Araneus ventricosus]